MKIFRKGHIRMLVIAAVAALTLGGAVYGASNYGSEDDPLITKSYLDTVVQPELERAMQAELEDALAGLENTGGEFTLLTLSAGQRVTGAVGTELILRFGGARAYAYDSIDAALVDTTSAATLMTGTALSVNHLYMVTIAGNGFTAAQDNTKILVSGEYALH